MPKSGRHEPESVRGWIGHMTTRNINVCFPGDVEGELCEETGVDIVGALDIIGEVNYCKAL